MPANSRQWQRNKSLRVQRLEKSYRQQETGVMVKVTIDSKTIEVAEGTTVLEAARMLNIQIPTLCHHPKLTPFGVAGCIVEVKGSSEAADFPAPRLYQKAWKLQPQTPLRSKT